MTAKNFVNKHLSYSRLSRFEQCPLSFRLHYIDKKTAEPGVPLKFGSLIHAVLEHLVREHMEDERAGPLSEERALEIYRKGWADEGLTGIEVFEEGLDLAVEKEFKLPVGRFTVLGFIDRVDCLDDETVEVIDYKTNRVLFTRDEVDHSLQMSLYHLAARQLWPWAKKVRLTFDMQLQGRVQALEVNELARNQYVAPPDWLIMEVKANENVPLWVSRMLARHNCGLRRIRK